MIALFEKVSHLCSKITTETYSTSFCSAINLLHSDLRQPIHNVYGFVRFADEIVDSFHDFDKAALLEEFKAETYKALERKISINPILNSLQETVHKYRIDLTLIDAFFYSMALDLDMQAYDQNAYETYIYGSAEVVGLMCLHVFCDGNKAQYENLKPAAKSLGAAFQKVNFLRDIKADFEGLNRTYFPGCDFANFTELEKCKIESDIQKDFNDAYIGIKKLPLKSRFGVYVAYKYYLSLFKKIKRTNAQKIMQERVRIPNYGKAYIVAKAGLRNQFNFL